MHNKMTKRKLQAISTKNKILDIALQQMTEKGYDNITVNKICKEADISIGTFYHHFKSKECIVIDVYKELDKYVREQVANNLKNTNSLDKIVEYTSHLAKYAKEMGINTIAQLYKSQIILGNELFICSERSVAKLFKDIVTEGQKKNEICDDISAEEITKSLLSFSRGIVYDWCLHSGNYDIEQELTKAMTRFVYCFKPIKNEYK